MTLNLELGVFSCVCVLISHLPLNVSRNAGAMKVLLTWECINAGVSVLHHRNQHAIVIELIREKKKRERGKSILLPELRGQANDGKQMKI